MTDLTVLDAPDTPAPLFAFRALKGAIFGSPKDDDNRDNKENATRPETSHVLRPNAPAVKAISASPSKRRKADQYLSPAKSILRTPGIPTPRKPNTNVTFKDVTPSLSPEITRKGAIYTNWSSTQAARSAKDATVSIADSTRSDDCQTTPVAAQKPRGERKPLQTIQSLATASHAFDFAAYQSSTEKELKKLVRYGQKMREYARKQDEENTKLRIALEKLQKENEALRLQQDHREEVRVGQKKNDQGVKKGLSHSDAEVSAANSNSASENENRMQSWKDQTPFGLTKAPTSTRDGPIGMSKARRHSPRQPSPLKRKASSQLLPEPEPQAPSGSLEKIGQRGAPVVTTSSSERNGQLPRASNARLAPDRLAAARERIRRKAELRKTTDTNASSPLRWDAL